MESIRIGKDIRVRWPIQSSAPLDTLALRLELESPLGVRTEEAFTLEGGSVVFYYPGTRQRDLGTYALTLWANYGAEGADGGRCLPRLPPGGAHLPGSPRRGGSGNLHRRASRR